MKIIVCVKQVIDTGAALTLKDGQVDTEGLPRVLNPYDEFAVEEAVRIREQAPEETTVTLITLGPDHFKDTLRKGWLWVRTRRSICWIPRLRAWIAWVLLLLYPRRSVLSNMI